MIRLGLFLTLAVLSGCAQKLGNVPNVMQLQRAVDFEEGMKTLSTVNCEGRTACYSASFGKAEVRNINCQSTGSKAAECRFEVRSDDQANWEQRRADFRIDVGPDGNLSWRLVTPTRN